MTTQTANINYINSLTEEMARESFFRCSGSAIWADEMISQMPFADASELYRKSDQSWKLLTKHDWLNAFRIHPKIGDIDKLRKKFTTTANWASSEQSGTASANEETLRGLAAGNVEYENKFGYIFIVFATGKSAPEMLTILRGRLLNSADVEFEIACGEQKKITNLRLEKLEP
jgi:2-oxo-4-hydroxy-4-carboxy-5-ureidoimidazoline decarboxylase